MMHQTLRFMGMSVVAGALCVPARAAVDPFQGAIALMEKSTALPPSRNTAPRDVAEDNYNRLFTAANDFTKRAATLAPDEAARQWLALFDRYAALPAEYRQRSMGRYNGGIFNHLPGPATWPILQKLVETRAATPPANPQAEATLLFALHTLNNQEPAQWADLAKMTAPGGAFESNWSEVLPLGNALSQISGQPADVEAYWTRTLASLAARKVTLESNATYIFALPDFVTLLGAAKAETLLTRALTLPGARVIQVYGEATQTLGRKIALSHLAEIKVAPWVLTQSLKGNELYEALVAKFPGDDSDNSEGEIYHVMALVVQEKVKEAVPAMAKLKTSYTIESTINQVATNGYGQQVYTFLKAYLAEQPADPLWTTFINVAARTGHADQALKLVQETLARKNLGDEAWAVVQPILYKALLAVDQTDAGVEQLRLLIKGSQEALAKLPATPAPNRGDTPTPTQLTSKLIGWDIELARLGVLLKREELTKEGVADAQTRTPKDQLVGFLINSGRTEEAETMLLAAMEAAADKNAAKDKSDPQSYRNRITSSETRHNLVLLTAIYDKAGQWEKITTLLNTSPDWGVADLVSIAQDQPSLGHYPTHNLALMAARALAETGKVDEARPLLNYVLQLGSSDDAAYALLLKIGEGDLVAKLDALYKEDQFENRPLIWKAALLLKQGKVAEAEEACKAAIVVDPSDGHTGKGDRMRVYSVMAEVCDAKGDTKQGDFFRNVVKAIRLSEDADDYYAAGLITRAVKMYEEALKFFSDAYCIQSRLARQLAQLGRMEEAAVHYRKAFELMPVSFGRMESHCFGCERAFEGKTASDIARQVFTEMLAKDPDKPQLYYLRGYLEMEEDQFPEAVADYEKAVKLDPDYINAWKKIITVGHDYQLNPALSDEAFFNVLRLDPTRRHYLPHTGKLRQLARLWTLVEASDQAMPKPPATLYPLKASAGKIAEADALILAWLAKSGTPGIKKQVMEGWREQTSGRNRYQETPRELVLRTDVIEAAMAQLR